MESKALVENVLMDCTENKEQVVNKRKRKKSNYRKINNETRQKLIEMVYLEDYLLKDASRILGVNYSTAKTILRIFRIEKRVEKKKADEERELKNVIFNFKQERKESENTTESLSPTAIGSGNMYCFSDEDRREPTFKLLTNDSSKSLTNFKILINNAVNEHAQNSHHLGHNFQNPNNLFLNMNSHMEHFTNQFRKLTHVVETCFKNIKTNQIMINSLINSSVMMKADPKNAQNIQHMMKLMQNNFQNQNQFTHQNQNNGNSYLNYNNTNSSHTAEQQQLIKLLKERQMGTYNN
jgi:transposase-like protein